jgi:hypothetical protein
MIVYVCYVFHMTLRGEHVVFALLTDGMYVLETVPNEV